MRRVEPRKPGRAKATRSKPLESDAEAPPAASATVPIQTALEQEHLIPGYGPPALQVNPEAHSLVILGAAQARMQAVTEGMRQWFYVEEEPEIELHRLLRPFHHLCDEVRQLLEALERRLARPPAT